MRPAGGRAVAQQECSQDGGYRRKSAEASPNGKLPINSDRRNGENDLQLNQRDQDKPTLDLHPSEWSHATKREPFWGFAARDFLIYAAVAIPCFWLVSSIVGLARSFLQ